MDTPLHGIRAVSAQTGLSAHVIRMWEKRYGAVKPKRTDTNRRLYSEVEIKRLALLKRAIQGGHSIGNVASLADEQLAEIQVETPPTAIRDHDTRSPESLMKACLTAIKDLDANAFEVVLTKAIVALGQHGLLERVVAPLTRMVGDLWRDGTISAAHEHFASAMVRTFLSRNARVYASEGQMPTLVVATPAGQLHELGAVIVAAAAHDLGWRVVYLGTSLPAAEIAGAAIQNQARAVALSLVYPEDDPQLVKELENLRKYLPAETALIVGGRAAQAYESTLRGVGASIATELKEFYAKLDQLRAAGGR